MQIEVPKAKPQEGGPTESVKDASDEQCISLNDEAIQAKYRAAYLEQVRRQSCPGCGETDIFD